MPFFELLSRLPLLGKCVDYIFQEARRKDANLEKHLADIKSGVLQPLTSQIQNYYLRAATQHSPVISLVQVAVPSQPVSVTQRVTSNYVYLIVPSDPLYRMYAQNPLQHSPYATGINAELYRDCLAVHYPEILFEWEEFVKLFSENVARCVELANREATRLKSTCDLPQSNSSDPHDCKSANYLRLGLFIVDRLMERSFYALDFRPEQQDQSFKLHIDFQDVAACDDKGQLQRLLAEVERGFELNKPDADKLNQSFKGLGDRIPGIIERLNRELLSHKKLMQCDFVS